VKVLVDGIEVNQVGGGFDFSGLLMSDVERIEVARGPASALYGSDAMAGVINILTRRGKGEPRGSISARAGTYGRKEWSADVQGGSAMTSYALSATRVSSEGILELNNQFRATAFSGSMLFTPDPRTRVSFFGKYGERIYHFPTDDAGNVVDTNAFTYGDEVILAVEGSRMVSDRIEVRGVVRGATGGMEALMTDPTDLTTTWGSSGTRAWIRSSETLSI
jgi:vitamin B12 transporter